MSTQALPPIVDAAEWQRDRDALLLEEKAATRLLDALAAKRRRLPMVEFRNDYVFDTATGPRTLLDLFDGRNQLAVYQFMDRGPEHFCPGCTWFTKNLPDKTPEMLAESEVTWMTISDMPLSQIEAYKAEQGWTIPFVSSHGTTFSQDCGTGGLFQFNAFLRSDDRVFRTYSTTGRGVDRVMFATNVVDLMPYGRQEEWEDSPPGWPKLQT